jgi:predicted PurR-regulated permease PerM
MIYIFVIIVAVILYFVISKKIEKSIKPTDIVVNKLNARLTLINSKLKAEIQSMKSNVEINDRYIEQLHTKISELEVTLQNFVNKN